jgi:hypothetical protein
VLGLDDGQVAAYFSALRAFAESGGNLVLTDAALLATADLGLVDRDAVRRQTGLAGFYGFNPYGDVMTYEHPEDYPLAAGVGLPGAAERTPGNRQAVEPTTIGYNPASGAATTPACRSGASTGPRGRRTASTATAGCAARRRPPAGGATPTSARSRSATAWSGSSGRCCPTRTRWTTTSPTCASASARTRSPTQRIVFENLVDYQRPD